ncbi:hypothetical protein H310_06727 [Aphanomyces invadans]|uniref:Uncharacterized protein n=1 Tax=Aphanomyces invadans TaxID=157072 RepID=A0A024U5D6_9STRA|nr:hypothetical protein H310_06727 [Aphanomyces invadans]ETW01112.1 hypothetical protein H310_06727 [Aphanomyces invadans]|eukprot:XP_008870110.1 hypothetical protein H310_06727 [Aphanomyces invadans]
MPSTVPGGDLLFCCGTSSSLAPKRGRPLQHHVKKPPHDRKQAKGAAVVLSSPRTDDDMEKMVDALRQSLHLTKPSSTPPTTLPHGVVKRRVYLSPRERVHSSTSRHNMNVLDAPTVAVRPLSSDGSTRADKLPTIAKQLDSSKATRPPDSDERTEASSNQSPPLPTATTHLTQSKSVDELLSNNATDGAALDHSKSCNDLESIRSQLAFGGFHVEFEEPETAEDSAPSSPMGPWLNQVDDVQISLEPASSPRTRLLSLSVDASGSKDVRRQKPVKVPSSRKRTASKKRYPVGRPSTSGDLATALEL